MALVKAEGGVGFMDLHNASLALKMRWTSRLLEDDHSYWVLLAKESIFKSPNSGFKRNTHRHWSSAEAILLDQSLHITDSPFLWNLARKWLCFDPVGAVLPLLFSIE